MPPLDVMEDAWWGPTIPLPNRPLVRAVGAQRPGFEALPYVEARLSHVRRHLRPGTPPG